MIMKFYHFYIIDLSLLSVHFNNVRIIFADIFEKMSRGGLEVSCIPDEKIQVNPRFWPGLEILF